MGIDGVFDAFIFQGYCFFLREGVRVLLGGVFFKRGRISLNAPRAIKNV